MEHSRAQKLTTYEPHRNSIKQTGLVNRPRRGAGASASLDLDLGAFDLLPETKDQIDRLRSAGNVSGTTNIPIITVKRGMTAAFFADSARCSCFQRRDRLTTAPDNA